jgi:hypothetical protein
VCCDFMQQVSLSADKIVAKDVTTSVAAVTDLTSSPA